MANKLGNISEFDSGKIISRTEIPVLVGYMNFGNHLAYDKLFTVLQDVRINFLSQHQLSEGCIEEGIGMFVVEAYAQYKSEAKLGDVLVVNFYVEKINRKVCDFIYKICNKESQDIVAMAATRHICFDKAKKSTCSIPENFLELIKD